MRPRRRGSACAVTVAVLLGAPVVGQQQTLARIAAARSEHEAGQSEPAAAELRALRRELAGSDDAAARKLLQNVLEPLLAKVDPADGQAQRLLEGAARDLLRIGQAYSQRKWPRAALPWYEAAAAASDRVVGKALGEARAAAGSNADSQPVAGIDGWFKAGRTFAGRGQWRIEDGTLQSPELGSDSVGYRSTRATGPEYRLTVSVRTRAEPAKASIAFAMHPNVNGNDYHLLELRHEPGFAQLRLLHVAQGKVEELAALELALSRAERAGFLDLGVAVRGDKITIGVGDIAAVEVRAAATDLAGCIGCFVAGDSAYKGPVVFRDLRVEAP